MSSEKPLDLTAPKAGTAGADGVSAASGKVTPPPPVRHSKLGDLHVLSEVRDTILYHGDDVITSKPVEESKDENQDDSFYEVTMDDVKSMYRDLQRRREELEGAPFKGQKLRALEKETAILKSLHDHPNTAIRIRFPDRHVLQGMFRTSDTIGSVKSWLREYLADSAKEFYLFTAPPKKVLPDEAKLVEEGLIAMVVIYFGSENMPEDNQVLKKAIYSKLSDPEKAFELAKNKLKVRHTQEGEDNEEIKPSTETQAKDHSGSQQASGSAPVRRPVDKGKVPKWFKMK